MPNEIELKLRIAKEDIPRLRRHPAILRNLTEKALTRRLVSTYYDTEDLQLLDRLISLRVRRMSGGWFQAVKAAGHSLAGLHQRLEWEDIISKGEPDYTKIIDPSLTPIFDNPALREALKPIFTTDMQRTEWQLAYQGSHIELSLDNGQLIAGQASEDMTEIELELKHGEIKHLFALALELQADIPLTIENISKAQRGYAYYRHFPLKTSKARSISIHPADSPATTFEQAGWECLRHLQSNQQSAMQGTDSEGVHQMRIALRRLRTVLRTFAIEDAYIETELDWLDTLLAKVRDLDVLQHDTLPQLKLGTKPLSAIQSIVKQRHKRACSKLRTGLKHPRYQHLLLTLGNLVATGLPAHDKSLKKTVKSRLAHLHKTLLKSGRKFRRLSAEERHNVRRHARQLRDTVELFRETYPDKKKSKQAALLSTTLKQMQILSGNLNDLLNARNILHDMTKRHPALQAVTSWEKIMEKLEKRHHSALPEAWKTLKQTKTFW
ncbi:adenylate cyclase [Methylobacillus rhizosphaerae]|uniref:Adenylate cyclase n=1 Tax=Methylobacillus rhizosphaerae TaxID=551994 RepID=A0A239AJX5_9PROT|nr:CYTH and CHAD domain-containing protein [Methylobacillus rhizosphaerae]SNR95975.1 adenylate cyclase [Methylobacillus rhizosphaerae]